MKIAKQLAKEDVFVAVIIDRGYQIIKFERKIQKLESNFKMLNLTKENFNEYLKQREG